MDKNYGLFTKYFVLNPYSKNKVHQTASRLAILTYSELIHSYDATLSDNLVDWMCDLGISDNIYGKLLYSTQIAKTLYIENNKHISEEMVTAEEIVNWLIKKIIKTE